MYIEKKGLLCYNECVQLELPFYLVALNPAILSSTQDYCDQGILLKA